MSILLRCFSGVLFLAMLAQCNTASRQQALNQQEHSATRPTPAFVLPAVGTDLSYYWHEGKAEISTYEVVQNRYHEERQAEQINIFVTEDFSGSKQVKLDDPATSHDRLPILKLNAIRRFHTGIYDYSLMTSVFSPTDGGNALKTTCSVQDWCGQGFFQTNLQGPGIRLRGFSYFETEGDTDEQVAVTRMEDELWNLIRLAPEKIPQGQVRLLPSILHARLRHRKLQPEYAQVTLEAQGAEHVLKVHYNGAWHSLSIRFESAPPHRIIGWEELGEKGTLMSKGTLKACRKSAYWAEHDNVHALLRDSLHLRF